MLRHYATSNTSLVQINSTTLTCDWSEKMITQINPPNISVMPFRHFLSVFLIVAILCASQLQAQPIDELSLHPAIPLLDETGSHVLNSGLPYSPKMTCGTGGCHDYDLITSAYHFETGRDEASDDFGKKTNGLSHLISPGYFGGYNCMGGDAPDSVAKKSNSEVSEFRDHGSAGYVKRCASCHAGGGWMEKDRDGVRYDEKNPDSVAYLDGDYFNRGTDENNQASDVSSVLQWDWKKSGVVENDCFLCHADLTELKSTNPALGKPSHGGPVDTDPIELMRSMRSTLIGGNHFRYTTSGILEFVNLNISDDASADKTLLSFARQDASHGVVDVSKLELGDDGLPQVHWNDDAFDADMKVEIPMLSYPRSDSCMLCHRTANSRRGFYGFGEDAALEYEEGGVLAEDYKDDVHYGLEWTEENGEKREIQNCNACHSRNYYNPSYANVDLDASHDFLKGNADIDLRIDLDYEKDAAGKVMVKTCVYCHDEAKDPAIPSGHDSMRDAHREAWRVAGDMKGYPESKLNQVSQKHLDVVSCETCHLTNKAVSGKTIEPMYRYAESADGKLRIRPYKPKPRNYWKNESDGYVFSKTELNSVFELRDADDGSKYGAIIDPVTQEQLGRVSARLSHGSYRFSAPDDYATVVALKGAYDSLLRSKNVSSADAVFVVSEINNYVLSHGSKPAVAALQCEQCHEQKATGAFSSLVSPRGLLGDEGHSMTFTTVPEKSLVDEGIIQLDYPYMQVSDQGEVTANVSDILYYSGINPSLSRLNLQSRESDNSNGNSATKSNGSGGGATFLWLVVGLLGAMTRYRYCRRLHM